MGGAECRVEHKLHFILHKTLRLLKQINTNAELHSRIGVLLLHFPEMPDIKVTEATFDTLVFNRKTQPYKKAIDIAKLLLLQYHPDVITGRHNVLALMFDMNVLWEKFVFVSLRKYKPAHITVSAQTTKSFWRSFDTGQYSTMRPDIVIKSSADCVVLDTKWKNINGSSPSSGDLRQMYVYHKYYKATRVALVYPGTATQEPVVSGKFEKIVDFENENICSVITLNTNDKTAGQKPISVWQKDISDEIFNFASIS